MSTTLNINPEQSKGTNSPIVAAIDRSFIICCVFLVVVLCLFTVNQVKLASTDPQSNKQINALIAELAKSPKDGNLKQTIRETDRRIRREYFRRLRFAQKGKYVCGFAFVLTLMSAGAAIGARRRDLPTFANVSESVEAGSKAAWGTLAVVVLFISFLAVSAAKRPEDLSREYSAAIAQAAKKPGKQAATSIMSAAPGTSSGQSASSETATQQSAVSSEPTPVLPAFPAAVGTIKSQSTASAGSNNSGMSVMPGGGGLPGTSGSESGQSKPKLPDIQIAAYDAGDYAPSTQDWESNWPIFRGPNGNGVIPQADYPVKWNGASGENLIWKADIPLPGWNSPVVWGDRLFITGADENQREIYCFDCSNGKLIWSRNLESVDPNAKKPQVLEDTGYAPSTCATDGRRVFCIFPNGDIFCHDYEGNLVWKKTLGIPINTYGHASSLSMYRNLLVVQFDQDTSPDSGLSAIYALQAKDGSFVWRTIRPVTNSWTTPLVLADQTKDMIITSANPWTIAYEPLTGKEIWRAKAITGEIAPSPAFADNKVFVANSGSYLAAMNINGSGDITNSGIVWKIYENLPDISSPAADDGFLFMTTSDGLFTCIDTSNGNKHYEHPFDVTINASPIIVGSRVYMLDSQGTMHVIPAAAAFSEESKGIVPDRTLATPAFVGGHIYLRGSKSLFCVGIKK